MLKNSQNGLKVTKAGHKSEVCMGMMADKVRSLITKDNRRRSPTKTGSHIRAISFVISERTLE